MKHLLVTVSFVLLVVIGSFISVGISQVALVSTSSLTECFGAGCGTAGHVTLHPYTISRRDSALETRYLVFDNLGVSFSNFQSVYLSPDFPPPRAFSYYH